MTTAHNNLVVCLCRGITLGRIVRGGRGSVATTRILVPPPPPASASASASSFSSSSLCLHNLINNNNNKTRKGFFCSPIMSQTDNLSSDSASAGFPTASFQNGGVTGAFTVSPSTLLKINKGDITRWSVDSSSDAIVNPANERMLGGGGADGAIHRAAGPELRDACYNVPEVRPGVRCPTGEARITPGFKLPASHVIHTVGPIYSVDGNPEASLRNAYRNSLTVAKDNNIKYIAFPAISCGVYGYPFDEAAAVAISAVKEFANDIKEVHFVLFSDDIYIVWLNKAKELLQA